MPSVTGSELVHWCCCDPDVGLCGADLRGMGWAADDVDVDCVVCIDLAEVDLPCGSNCPLAS
ncbi:hypothetical protein [Embleya sp. NPDC005971]|uniref:hypothetical protein n=1 Tax=Embleya sp. NPDC005971 TaxID=3156724 RepID=UPI0033D29D41